MNRRFALQLLAFAALVVVVAILPRVISDFRASQFAFVGLYFVAIVGLNVLVGYSGQISLGHGAFMAIGGYTTAILMVDHGVKDVYTIPVAALVAGCAGLLVGIPALRLSGLYLAIATFGIAVAMPELLKKFEGLTGGTTGKSLFGIPEQTGLGVGPKILGRQLTGNDWLYYLSWGVGLALFALAWALLAGPVGRSLRAVRDSEVAAAAVGIHPARWKVLAFGISAAYAGVAGSLLAINVAFVNPDTFPIPLSLTLLVGAVIGGLGSLYGAVLGAAFIEFLPVWVQGWSKQAPQVIYGAAIVLLMLLLPTGFGGLLTRLKRG
jgi:branched-chain amino acid transport system permease protein